MKFYEGRAFTSEEKVLGCEVIGNPAVVAICEEEEVFPAQEEMAKVAIEKAAPITVFVKKRAVEGEEKEFDVRYFFPDGSEVNFCGHGTFVSSYVLNKIFDLPSVNFHLVFNNETITANINKENLVSIKIPKYSISDKRNLINDESFLGLTTALQLSINDIDFIYECEKIGDIVIVIKDAQKIKNIKPDFEAMVPCCRGINCRTLMCTSKSDFQDFNYEIRVFIPHIGINEDIVCGSANTHIANFWYQRLGKKTMKSLYPYNDFGNSIGGVQYIDVEEDLIVLSGYVK